MSDIPVDDVAFGGKSEENFQLTHQEKEGCENDSREDDYVNATTCSRGQRAHPATGQHHHGPLDTSPRGSPGKRDRRHLGQGSGGERD